MAESWRDIKARARAMVHRTFQIPAVYLTHAAGVPVRCNVRHHSKVETDQNEFVWPKTSGLLMISPGIVFDKAEVPSPLPKSFVIIGPTEIYQIGVVEPFREAYAKADVTTLALDKCAALLAQVDATNEAYLGIV